jgi:YVTN family beta-propeller protein
MTRANFVRAVFVLAVATCAGQAQSLLVVNQGDATVSVVDAKSLSVTATIAEHESGKDHGHEIAVSPDGKTAYLPVYGDSGVGKAGTDGTRLLFVNVDSHTVEGSVEFGHGVRPHDPIVDAKTGLVCVTTELDKSIAIIDPKTRKVVGSVPTGAEQSHMLVLSHDGRFGYTANVGPGTVSVLDMKARKTLAVIPVAKSVQRIAISNDDKLVFTSDNTKPRLAVIDTATRSVRQWVELPALGYGAAATKDGRSLLIALPSVNQVGVVDLGTMKVVARIDVGEAPQAIVMQPDGRRAYVSCAESGTVSAIDVQTMRTIKSVATASGADGMAWTGR